MQPVFSTSTHIVLATVQGGRRLFCLFLGFEGISIAAPETFPVVPGPTADETKIDSANQPMCRSVVEDGIRDSVSVLGRRHARVA